MCNTFNIDNDGVDKKQQNSRTTEQPLWLWVVKWLTPHACKTTVTIIDRALFVHNLKYPLNKVVIREDDLEKVLIHMLKVKRQVVQGYLVLCVDDSEEEEEDYYDPLAVSPWGPHYPLTTGSTFLKLFLIFHGV